MSERVDFVGEFKNLLRDFIEHKRALGYKYTSISESLRRFSSFTLKYKVKNKVLSKEIVLDWTAKKKSESVKTWEHRASDLRQFALYLKDLGYEVYIPEKKHKVRRSDYIPYIFTIEEIHKFFYACDHIQPNRVSNKHYVLPVLFRLLYCCGLRVSEAISLKVGNFDLDSGTVMIRESKFNKDRLIPMAESLTGILRAYRANVVTVTGPQDYFFINKDRSKLTRGDIYKRFREILWKAGISHGGKGRGPRLHDLRHNFCIYTLNKMVNKGIDLYCALPILSTYLGHSSVSATQRYVRLTTEVYPELVEKVSKSCAYVFPEVKIK